MTTSIDNQAATDTINPFLTDEIFPHLVELTSDPLDAILLASDGLAALEYVAACTIAQQAGTTAPEIPKFRSMFLHDLGSAVVHWIERCLKFAAKEAKKANADFVKLRASRTRTSANFWTSAQMRAFFDGFMRAAKPKAVR